jgi:hypothetical protein
MKKKIKFTYEKVASFMDGVCGKSVYIIDFNGIPIFEVIPVNAKRLDNEKSSVVIRDMNDEDDKKLSVMVYALNNSLEPENKE